MVLHRSLLHSAFIFLFCFSAVFARAQANLFLDGRMHYGFIVPHSPRMEQLITGHTTGFQLNIGKQTGGVSPEREWHNIYNYPQTGISLVYIDFANPEQLGSAFGALVFADLPLIRNKNFMFSLNLGSGFGYMTKKFETEENHKNTITGTHLNGTVQIFFQTSYRISRRTDFRLALGLTHFSNGSYTMPNLGINNVSLSSGIVFYLDTSRFIPQKKIIPPANKKIRYQLMVAGGPKEIYPPRGKKYFAWTFSAEALKPLSHKYRFGIGTDLFYDLSLDERLSHDSVLDNSVSNRIRSGIYISNEFVFSQLTVLLQIGAYLYYPYKDDGRAYHRFGFRYLCSRHLFINLTLRTHYARADNTELGFGYKF